ncbi:hypothetical protein OS188_13530 [Xanthomarina sp. F1114]|uniref:hypothetical protein n=1 Tax=Xanthomarina sp. F1114 TaxID=2996019 RepID=UPI00225DCE16|nr:hypothetical protein [Xanthomarina sp. F1114]MCX7548971.1 hypothetical protein [Xanthomarina sp. F1114]
MAKQGVFLLCFLSTLITFAQDSTYLKVETPKIVAKLFLGKTYHIEDVQIKFSDVLADSRCPEDITCVWAGEATVLVDIIENGTLREQKKLIFQPGKRQDKKLFNLFSSETTTITALKVLPNLNSKKKLKKEAYYLLLEIVKKE